MRAAIYEALGGADVLRVAELDTPEPDPDEVRVRVVLSGVNPTDWKLRSAAPGRALPFDFQVPNQDGAGVIDKVGPGVDPSRIGEHVWIYLAAYERQFGTAEELICLPARQAVAMPDSTSFELGASLGVPALTAHHALFCDGPIAGRSVLVAGGAGAVGHFAIELAKWKGAHVITTVSSEEKAALARAAGADVVINYRESDVAKAVREVAPEGVQRIIEVAPENFELDLDVLALGGTIVFYASTDAAPIIPVRRMMNLNATLRFMLLYTIPNDAIDRGVLDISAALEAAVLSELPAQYFDLDQAADAHRAVEAAAIGKVFIDLRD